MRRLRVLDLFSGLNGWGAPWKEAGDGKRGQQPNLRETAGQGSNPSLGSMAARWPTPNAMVSNEGEGPETWLARQARMKEKGINGNGAVMPLSIAAQLYPTPAARDYRSPNSAAHVTTAGTGRRHMDQLPNFVAHTNICGLPAPETPTDGESSSSESRRLNLRFVERLMGFPIGWTGYTPLETRSYRWWPRMRGELSRLVSEREA